MTLAQRMIVMNAGRIEQIGTPEQVYGTPATTFVAGFIGSPPMNLLKGQADGSRFTGRRASRCRCRRPRRAAGPDAGRAARACRLSTRGGPWPLKVEMLEMLGAERLVYGRLGDASCSRCAWRHAAAAARRRHRAA
jgi:sn-glycerol 3-phosphate transport system ATP-binding protein